MSNVHPFMGKLSLDGKKGRKGIDEAKNWLNKSSPSNAINMTAQKLPSSRRIMFASSMVVFVCAICNINSTSRTLATIRRILCLDDGYTVKSPYIFGQNMRSMGRMSEQDVTARMNPPPIQGRRPIPSHIEMCQAFLKNRDDSLRGVTPTRVHITEDESVCSDWSTPHSSIFEIFSGQIINHVSQKYGVTYSHDCHKVKTPDTGDGLDWTTIQQEFPPSGLVLDDGSITEDDIVGLCKGCMSSFNAKQATSSVDKNHPNPSWFNPHSTHHCIVYPGSPRPLTTSEGEEDLAAEQEHRLKAQQAPIARVYKTAQDRLKLAAVKHKLQSIPAFSLANGMDVEDEEEKDGTVIYMDEGSMPMSLLQIQKNIPKSAKVISILASPLCVRSKWEEGFQEGESCMDYVNTMSENLQTLYPDAEVSSDVPVSTAASTSRMIRSKNLICPPGTISCALPALAKEEDTFAVVGESARRAATEQFYDFMSDSESFLQIANVDSGNVKSGLTRSVNGRFSRGETDVKNHNNDQGADMDLMKGLQAFEKSSRSSGDKADFADGCVKVRGRQGDWESDLEQEYVYGHLRTKKNSLLRGSSIEDVVSLEEEGQETRADGAGNKSEPMGGRGRSWADVNPECDIDLLNREGLCEVMNAMKLSVLQFIGDQYTEKQVKSFWSLLDLDNRDAGRVKEGNPGEFRKQVPCEKEKITFDVAFTPNEKLDSIPQRKPVDASSRYVAPQSNRKPEPINPIGRTDTHTTINHHNTNGWGGNGWGGNGAWGRVGGCWGNPYGAGCGCAPGAAGGNMAQPMAAGRTVASVAAPQSAPQFNQACQCIPFSDQYNYNYAHATQSVAAPQAVVQSAPQAVVNPYPYASGRQFVVAGLTPNQSYGNFVQGVDQFGRTVMNTVDANDIVVLRTGAAVPPTYGGTRRTQKSEAMSLEEIGDANNYLYKAVDEYQRRTRQTDLLTYDPAKSRLPYVHILDVAHMTHSHPLANEEEGSAKHRDLKSLPDLYDHWNHLLYSNMRDMAAAELARKSAQIQAKQHSAPPGSPYENSVPIVSFAG